MPLPSNKKFRLAVLTSHPIEYQGPFFQYIAKKFGDEIDLTVYFCWDFGVKETYEPAFASTIKWDFPILEGYRYKFLRNFSLRPTSSNFFGEINPGIISEIMKNKYDAVLVFGWNFLTSWFAFSASFLSGVPVFLRGENPLSAELRKTKLKVALKRAILGWLFKRVAAVLYIGEENRKFYGFYGVPDYKLFFMPYAVDNEKFMAEAEQLREKKADLKKAFGFSPSKVVILFAGKLIQKKRPLDLLNAYAAVKSQSKALVFMGDGPLRGEIQNIVKEKNLKDVRIAGFIGQTEVKNYYAAADVFVLPSDARETWGLVVNEAMCFGLPIIVSSEVGCGSDIVHVGENGYLFSLGEIKTLAQHLEALVESRSQRESFGRRSLEIVQSYNYAKDVEGILKALHSLAGEKR